MIFHNSQNFFSLFKYRFVRFIIARGSVGTTREIAFVYLHAKIFLLVFIVARRGWTVTSRATKRRITREFKSKTYPTIKPLAQFQNEVTVVPASTFYAALARERAEMEDKVRRIEERLHWCAPYRNKRTRRRLSVLELQNTVGRANRARAYRGRKPRIASIF